MDSSLTIQIFNAPDADAVADLWREVLPTDDPWNETTITIWRQQRRQPEGFFVGRLDDQIVATCIAGYDGVRGWLYRVAVSPTYRGNGYGRQMVERAERYLAELGCPKVNLQVRSGNDAAVRFYESIDYYHQNHHSMAKLLSPVGVSNADPQADSLSVDHEIQLTSFVPDDQAEVCRILNASDVYSRNTTIPFPYTEAKATAWFSKLAALREANGADRVWAIRARDGSLLGAIGLHAIRKQHSASIGYWVSTAHWNRGIASRVVGRICEFGFRQLNLVRLAAEVVRGNDASVRVLEKNGFSEEGLMRKAHWQRETFQDVRLFARLQTDRA